MACGTAGLVRRIEGGRNTVRARGFMVEVAEEIIRNIICAGDLLMEFLAELNYTLGIWIIRCGGIGGPDSWCHFSSSLGASGGSGGGTSSRDTGANDDNLSIINCGPIGSIPVVHQLLTEESGSCLSDTKTL